MHFGKFTGFLFLSSFLFLGCDQGGEKVVAKVGQEKVYASDIELMFKERRLVSNNPNVGRYVTNLYHDISQVSTGTVLYPGVIPLVKEDMRQMENRLLTSVYQRFYAFENFFASEKKLRDFYLRDTTRFAVNGQNYPYSEVKAKVGEALYIEKNAAEYKKFLGELQSSMETPATANVFYRTFEDSLSAFNFKETLDKTTEVSKMEGLQPATLKKGEKTGILGNENIQSEIFKDYSGNRNALVMADSSGKKLFVVFHVGSVAKEIKANTAELERMAKTRFIDKVKKDIVTTTGPKLVEKHKLEIVPPKPVDPKVYYEKTLEQWKTKPGLWVYHIENKDSLTLGKAISSIKTQEEFSRLAATSINENPETRGKAGEMGSVLEEHSLPYGVGLLPELFSVFKKDTSVKTLILKGKNAYHGFYIVKTVPETQKPFERVEHQIKQDLANNILAADSNAPLVSKAGVPVLFEKDLMTLYSSLDPREARQYNRAQLASYLMEWYAFAEEAKAVKLDTTAIYKAVVRKQERVFARRYILDSVKTIKILSEQEAAPYFEKYGKAFPDSSLKSLLPILSELAANKENDIRYEYWRSDLSDSSSFTEVLPSLLPTLSKNLKERQVLRFTNRAEQENPLEVLDSAFLPEKPWGASYKEMEAFIGTHDSNKQSDKLIWDLSLLRVVYPEVDSIYASTTIRLAQVHGDREEYEESLKEYNAFIGMWPDHPLLEKALFAKGFILDENLKRKDEALKTFKFFLEKFPKSELAESVTWLVKNIENQGKLAEELIKKIEKE